MSKKLLRKKLALMLDNLKKKRPFYCELEYLQSSGTQYIDTGFKIDDTCGYDVSWMALDANDRIIIGTKGSGDSRWVLSGSNNPYVNLSWNTSYGSSGLGLNKIQTARMNYLNDRKRILNNIQVTNISETLSPNASTYNVCIFAGHWGSGTVGLYSTCRIYYAKITKGATLIRDMIPVLDWNMTPCMYDRVTEQLFYNAGTGNFVAGRQIHPVEYLEGTGTQYIDTGYIPNINTECSMNLAFVSLDSTYRTPFSVRTADGATNSFTIMSSRETNDNNSFAFGSNYWSGPSVPKVVLNKTVEAVLRKGYAYWDGVSGNPGNSITPTTLTAYMFARNSNGTAGNFFIGRIYDCQLKENDTLVRDYIPAIDENGVGFMFDRVSHTIFDNAGTGNFAYPPVEIEYLESTGTQYINTGIFPINEMEFESKFTFTSLVSTNLTVIGSRDSTKRCQPIGAYNNKWSASIGGSYDANGSSVSANTSYVVKSIISNGQTITLTVNGNQASVCTSTTGLPNQELYIFGRNFYGNTDPVDSRINAKMYFMKIKAANVLVRDFIPCFKDGVACMVNKLTGTAYLNQGTGSFITGKIVESIYE